MLIFLFCAESKNRPCRFFKSPDGCFKGDECPYLHLENGK